MRDQIFLSNKSMHVLKLRRGVFLFCCSIDGERGAEIWPKGFHETSSNWLLRSVPHQSRVFIAVRHSYHLPGIVPYTVTDSFLLEKKLKECCTLISVNDNFTLNKGGTVMKKIDP